MIIFNPFYAKARFLYFLETSGFQGVWKETMDLSGLNRYSEKAVLKILAKFTRKNLCHSLFLNKVARHRTATLSKERL